MAEQWPRIDPREPGRAQESPGEESCVYSLCVGHVRPKCGSRTAVHVWSAYGPCAAHMQPAEPACSQLSPRVALCVACEQGLIEVWMRFEWGLNKAWVRKHWNHGFIMLLYYAFSMQTQQPHIINPIQYNSGNLEIAGLWLVELCPVNPIKRFRSYSIVRGKNFWEVTDFNFHQRYSNSKLTYKIWFIFT